MSTNLVAQVHKEPMQFNAIQLWSSAPYDPGPLESTFLMIMEILPRYASINNYPIFGCIVTAHSNFLSEMCFPPTVYHPLVSFHSQLSLSFIIGFPIISNMRFYGAHSMFDEMTLSGICYFSLINGSLHFKQWDPGTNKAPGSDHPITILVVCLEDETIIGTVGEWIHEPYDPLYVCFFENWYKCPAIKALNIPTCLRRLLELLYVDEYPNYVALKYDAALEKSTLSSCKDACLRNCLCLVLFCENGTGRCFHLDQIGHFQHFKKVKSGYVLCVTCSKAMLTDWGQFSVSAIHIAFSCIRFPNFFLDYVGTNANFLNESHPTIIFELAPSSSFWSIFVIVNTMLVLKL